MRLLLLLCLGGLIEAARSFAPARGLGSNAGGVTLAAGFLVLTALLTGSLFQDLRLPRLTGYLVAGAAAGPHLLGLVSEEMVLRLSLFNGIAISLIALTAGAEIDLRAMRPLLRTIGWLTLTAVVGTMVVLSLTAFALRPLLPFLEELEPSQIVAVCVVLGVMLTAQSPAVVVALRDEMQAEGPLTRTVLGVVVLSDLVVILLFAAASAIAQASFGDLGGGGLQARALVWEILGSLAIGCILGQVVAFYLRHFSGPSGFTVVILGFLVAEVGRRIQLDPLLTALAAGMLVRNATSFGDRLQSEIHSAALPVYVIFFALAGASIKIDVLPPMMLPVLILVVVRAASFLAGARLGAGIAGAPPTVRRYVGYGMLPQAGLALALALLFSSAFENLGQGAAALVFGVVAVNELICPVLYRYALIRSGEAVEEPAGESEQALASVEAGGAAPR